MPIPTLPGCPATKGAKRGAGGEGTCPLPPTFFRSPHRISKPPPSTKFKHPNLKPPTHGGTFARGRAPGVIPRNS